MLAQSLSALEADLRKMETLDSVSARVRRDQLRQAKYAIQTELAAYWEKVGSEVQARRILAARDAGDLLADATQVLARAGLSKTQLARLRRGMVDAAEKHLEASVARMQLSKVPLSKQVYKTSRLTTGQVDRKIQYHLARGSSARELAADMRDFINPKTPGGVRFASMRLARTEINNAYHAVTVQEAAKQPFVTGMKWNLSGTHPKPDACNDYAEVKTYEPSQVPAKPHPNCLCYVTEIVLSDDAFIAAFKSGKMDDWLKKEIGYSG